MSRNGSVLTIYLMPTKNSDSFKDLMVMQFYSLGINLCLGSHLTVNSNLIKMSGYTQPETLAGNMFRLTEPGKNIRLDPNLDPHLTILQS